MLDLVPDLCDLYPNHVRIAEPVFQSFGGKTVFHGEVVTVQCFEDNSRVKELVSTNGTGKVMVVDGGGSRRRALLGDLLASQAVKNGWEGLLIFGCVRDVGTIGTLNLGVQALAAAPFKTDRKGIGETGVPVTFAGLTIEQGNYVYCDLNGIAVAKQPLAIS